jgi:hypothetical protein
MGFGSSRHAYTESNCNADGKQYANSNVHTNCYCYCDSYSYSYSDRYSYCHGDALSDAYVPTGRFPGAVDAGSAGRDRSLRGLHGQRWHLCL